MRTRLGSRAMLFGASLLAGTACASAQPAGSERAERQQRLVDRATLSAQELLDPRLNGDQAQRFLDRARAVMICPSVLRMSFLIGGSGGGCVLLARDGAGSWSAPAFYSMGSGSVGFQAGLQNAELIMFVMTNRGLNAIMNSQFKFGANASITLATLGTGVEGATTAALRADIVALEKSSGLFAGIALQGSLLSFDRAGAAAYYGQTLGVRDIIVSMRVNNAGDDPLRATLLRYGAAGHVESAVSGSYPDAYRPNTAYSNPDAPDEGATTPDDGTNGPMKLAPAGGSVQTQSLPPPH